MHAKIVWAKKATGSPVMGTLGPEAGPTAATLRSPLIPEAGATRAARVAGSDVVSGFVIQLNDTSAQRNKDTTSTTT